MRREFQGRAIVLNALAYGDSDLIVSFMTEELGVVRGLAKGGRASRKRFAGCFEPFTSINLGCRMKDSASLAGITSADIVNSHLKIRDSLDRINAGARMLELAGTVEVHGAEAATAFGLLDKSLEILETSTDPAALSGIFFVKWLDIAGYKLPHETCGQCGGPFETPGGTGGGAPGGKPGGPGGAYYRGGYSLVCGKCAGGRDTRTVSAGTLAFISRAETLETGSISRLRLSEGGEKELFGLLGPYIASIAGRSLKTL
ncbi:MAG: DNA repair protein RecO [Nitrospirae bacterium]|nr:DNA repair protein RecO [Nitrospirota bacterium]